MLCRGRGECVLEDSIRVGKSLIDIAGTKLEMITNVRLLSGFHVREIRKRLRRSVLLMDEG
jgi:hypothetical protein